MQVSAEARGKVRLFRQKIAPSSALISKLGATNAMHDELGAWAWKKGIGQQRVAAKIKKRLGPAVHWHETLPTVMLGFYLHPAAFPLIVEGDAGQTQTSVMVKHFMVIKDDMNAEFKLGPWTLEVPDHALGRILERMDRNADPFKTLESVLIAAHYEALKIGVDGIPLRTDRTFLLKTPHGAFLSQLEIGQYPDRQHESHREVIIRPRTWLHDDQFDEQGRALVSGRYQTTVPHGHPTLGATFLLPKPARELLIDGNKLRVLPNQFADGLLYNRDDKITEYEKAESLSL